MKDDRSCRTGGSGIPGKPNRAPQKASQIRSRRGSAEELRIAALRENLPRAAAFIDERLEAADCPPETRNMIGVSAEEIFINIACYAYAPGTGYVTISAVISGDPAAVTITFADRGAAYNPLARTDPDITLPAGEREIGGLGIFLTKQLMDEVSYEYRNGENILTLKKYLREETDGARKDGSRGEGYYDGF